MVGPKSNHSSHGVRQGAKSGDTEVSLYHSFLNKALFSPSQNKRSHGTLVANADLVELPYLGHGIDVLRSHSYRPASTSALRSNSPSARHHLYHKPQPGEF